MSNQEQGSVLRIFEMHERYCNSSFAKIIANLVAEHDEIESICPYILSDTVVIHAEYVQGTENYVKKDLMKKLSEELKDIGHFPLAEGRTVLFTEEIEESSEESAPEQPIRTGNELLENLFPQNPPIDKEIMEKVDEEAEVIFKERGYEQQIGSCHVFWGIKKEILKEKYGIDWYTPAEQNPFTFYD